MRIKTFFLYLVFLLFVCALGLASSAEQAQQTDEIFNTYRKIIVLTSDDGHADSATRERTSIIARMLFQQNEDRIAALRTSISADQGSLKTFLDQLEKNSEYHDADKLVFRDLLDDISAGLPST